MVQERKNKTRDRAAVFITLRAAELGTELLTQMFKTKELGNITKINSDGKGSFWKKQLLVLENQRLLETEEGLAE